jgi:hypothetical protein
MGTNITSLRLVDPDNLNVQVCTLYSIASINLPLLICEFFLRTVLI